MNAEKLISAFKDFAEMQESVIVSKNQDYANADALSNFKLSGQISGIGAKRQALSMIAVKVARLGVLLSSDKLPNNESVEDSVLDLANYAFLLHAIIEDEKT